MLPKASWYIYGIPDNIQGEERERALLFINPKPEKNDPFTNPRNLKLLNSYWKKNTTR